VSQPGIAPGPAAPTAPSGAGLGWGWLITGFCLVVAVCLTFIYFLVLGGPEPAAVATTGTTAGTAVSGSDPRGLLWTARAADLVGQAAVIFAAALGVLVLFGTEGKK